jgi:hypothetical protein
MLKPSRDRTIQTSSAKAPLMSNYKSSLLSIHLYVAMKNKVLCHVRRISNKKES